MAAPPVPHRVCLLPGTVDGGGIGQVMLTLAEGLVARGIAVDLALTLGPGTDPGRPIPPGVTLVRLAPRTRSAIGPLRRHLRATRPGALITARDHLHLLGLAARRLAGLQRSCRLIWTYHTHRSAQLADMSLPERLADALALRLVRRPDARVAVSAGVAEDLAMATGLVPSQIDCIPNPAWSAARAAAALAPCPHPWLADRAPGARNPDAPVVVGLGRLVQQKDFATLIHAFARLRALQPRARLIIAGAGPEQARISALLAEQSLISSVDLCGHLADPLPLLARADLFVLSSRWEGFALALVEAMGCGCPVVSTDCPTGPAMILQDGRLGPLVPPGDPAALAGVMAEVLASPPDPGPLRARAADFDADRAIGAWLELLR